MNFTKGDLNQIRKNLEAQKLELTGGSFFSKKAYDGENELSGLTLGINELIYAEIAKRIGLISPEIFIVKPEVENNIFIVSEDLNILGSFKSFKDLNLGRMASSSLREIEEFLTKLLKSNPVFSSQIPRLIGELITVYFLDIFLSFWDRLPDNFGLVLTDNTLSLAVLDNEYALSDFIFNISSLDIGEKWFKERQKLLALRTLDYSLYEQRRYELIRSDLLNFYASEYHEYWFIFEKLYAWLTPSFLLETLEKLENMTTIYGLHPEKLVITNKDAIVRNYEKLYAVFTEVKRSLDYGRK